VKVENIPQYIRTHRHSEIVVEFDDSDRYPAAALDLQGENEEGEFEIYVAFRNCLGKSHAYTRAVEAGSPEQFPGSWWSSDKPRQPVGMTYTLGRIKSVYDAEAGYQVYEKEQEG
jgi:hypothetical protein